MEIAAESSSLFIDGTFAICPKPFKQVLILRGKVGSSVHTIAYALLPDKKEKTYNDTLKAILEVCTEMDVAYVHCDCEQGLVNAVERHFPNAQIRLCFFHVSDAIRRRVSSQGLRGTLRKNHNRFIKKNAHDC